MGKKSIKKLISAVVLITLIVLTFSSCGKADYSFENNAANGEISVVSFNCAAPWGSFLKGTHSAKRVELFAEYMNAVGPDIIGTQEMNSKWLEKLKDLMSGYESYGVKRGGDDNENKSEMNAVFWNKTKFECVEKNTFWLSQTPDTESRYENAGCHRVCTYVVLKNRETGETFLHMNTHLDNASDEARNFGAELLVQKLQEIKKDSENMKVIVTGDFNVDSNSDVYRIMTADLTDCSSAAAGKIMSTYTQWGELDDEGAPIDFIFTNGSPVSYETLNDISNGFVSDHYGIYAIIRITED